VNDFGGQYLSENLIPGIGELFAETPPATWKVIVSVAFPDFALVIVFGCSIL
jgi:hypothetical protein